MKEQIFSQLSMERFGGEQFLHRRDQELHTEGPVKHEQERRKVAGEETSQKPAEKLKAWMDVLERTHMGHRDDPRVLERIKKHYCKEYVIKQAEVPESAFLLEQQIARNLGHGNIEITDEFRERKTAEIIRNQTASLNKWVDYLTSTDATYPTWAKYWAFRSMVGMGKLEKKEDEQGRETARFTKRDKDTVAAFPPMSPRALAMTIGVMEKWLAKKNQDEAVKKQPKAERQATRDIPNQSTKLNNLEFKSLVSTENFSKIYAQFLIEMPEYSTEGLQEIRGQWTKYEQGSDAKPLVDSLEGYPLEWCTANINTAQDQLAGGDFYVFYSIDEAGKPIIPRVAILMQGNSHIAEVRGIAPDQNVDPYITPVIEEKLTEFGSEAERYKKKSADMKRLTSIESVMKTGGDLDAADLKFLYELDSPIEGFGHNNSKDPRIAELRSQRNPETDALIVFDCRPEQIAHNVREINKHTKAYVGELQPGIFNKLSHDVEHIYTAFPEGRVKIIKDLELGTGPKTGEEFIQFLEAQGYRVEDYAKRLLRSPEFKVSQEPQKIDLVILRVDSMGRQFANGESWQVINERALEFGLGRCPAEAGPQFRSQYSNQPKGEWIGIGMEPIADAVGGPNVFDVNHADVERWLFTYWTNPDHHWLGDPQVAFVRRK